MGSVECSLTQSLILYGGLEPFLCAESELQACITSDVRNALINNNKKKSRAHLLSKKNKTISLPKKVQRLSDVKVSVKIVKSKWKLLNNYNNNKNVGLKIIKKASWARNQKIWAQSSVAVLKWDVSSLRLFRSKFVTKLVKSCPHHGSSSAVGTAGCWAGFCQILCAARTMAWGTGHGAWTRTPVSIRLRAWLKMLPWMGPAPAGNTAGALFLPCSSCSSAIKGSTQKAILPPSRTSAFPCRGS